MRLSRLPVGFLTFILWLVTIAVGLWEILIVRDMFVRLYARFGHDYGTGLAIRNWTVLPLSVVWLAFAIGTGEYHRLKAGQRASWLLFGRTIAAEAAVLILVLII